MMPAMVVRFSLMTLGLCFGSGVAGTRLSYHDLNPKHLFVA